VVFPMRYVFVILLFISCSCFAQKDTAAVLDAVMRMEKALVDKNKEVLEGLLHKDVAFGHSSGWVQTKKDVMKDMSSGFLVYAKIENNSIAIEAGKKKAIVKERITATGKRDNKDFELALFVMQVWVKTKKGWQLFARQSTKL
jgi:uncharacterized protein DUF4440